MKRFPQDAIAIVSEFCSVSDLLKLPLIRVHIPTMVSKNRFGNTHLSTRDNLKHLDRCIAILVTRIYENFGNGKPVDGTHKLSWALKNLKRANRHCPSPKLELLLALFQISETSNEMFSAFEEIVSFDLNDEDSWSSYMVLQDNSKNMESRGSASIDYQGVSGVKLDAMVSDLIDKSAAKFNKDVRSLVDHLRIEIPRSILAIHDYSDWIRQF